MADFLPKHLKTKSGKALYLREVKRKDATTLIQHINIVASETPYLTYGQGDFNPTLSQEEDFISKLQESPNQIGIVAEVDQEIIGLLTVKASQKPRIQHIGEFGISIQKKCWGEGIGAHLLQAMLEWADKNELIKKINLMVLTHNTSAIHLYKKLGFEEEGCMRRASYQDGQFYDAYHMGKLID